MEEAIVYVYCLMMSYIYIFIRFFYSLVLHECLLIVQTEILCDNKYGVCFSFVTAFSTNQSRRTGLVKQHQQLHRREGNLCKCEQETGHREIDKQVELAGSGSKAMDKMKENIILY